MLRLLFVFQTFTSPTGFRVLSSGLCEVAPRNAGFSSWRHGDTPCGSAPQIMETFGQGLRENTARRAGQETNASAGSYFPSFIEYRLSSVDKNSTFSSGSKSFVTLICFTCAGIVTGSTTPSTNFHIPFCETIQTCPSFPSYIAGDKLNFTPLSSFGFSSPANAQ